MTRRASKVGPDASNSGRDERGRFLPGKSGNKRGRPPKTGDDQFDLMGIMMEPVTIRQQDGRVKQMPYLVVYYMKLKERALGGDKAAVREINTIMGKLGIYEASKRAQVQQYDAQKDYDRLMQVLDERAAHEKKGD